MPQSTDRTQIGPVALKIMDVPGIKLTCYSGDFWVLNQSLVSAEYMLNTRSLCQ